MRVSVDFDGTITLASNHLDPNYNKLNPKAKEVINKLAEEEGIQFVLLTGREDKYLPECLKLIKEWEIDIDTSTPTRKQICDYYIDDKNIELDGGKINWRLVYLIIKVELSRRRGEL